MAKGFKHGAGGGGASLNFKVVGNPQPVSPKENTIWVDTDVEITSWVFSATEPENPSEGMVWIATSTSGPVEFNALKKNSIVVCPLFANQYIDGTWVDKTGKIYQNSAWSDWIRYIFRSGIGALVPLAHFSQSSSGTASHTTDCITHYCNTSGNVLATTTTEVAVEFKGSSTLYARAKCTYQFNADNPLVLGLFSTVPTGVFATPNIALLKFKADSVETVYSLPIPSDIESAFVGLRGAGRAEIYDIWLE